MQSQSEMNLRLKKAIHKENFKEVLEALNSGAEINLSATDETGDTAPLFHLAVVSRRIEIIEQLIMRGADLDIRDPQEKTSLMHADGFPVIQLLLRNRANVNAQDVRGDMRLHESAYFGEFDVVRLLCEHKADCTVKNTEGKTAIEEAKDSAVVAFLREEMREQTSNRASSK